MSLDMDDLWLFDTEGRELHFCWHFFNKKHSIPESSGFILILTIVWFISISFAFGHFRIRVLTWWYFRPSINNRSLKLLWLPLNNCISVFLFLLYNTRCLFGLHRKPCQTLMRTFQLSANGCWHDGQTLNTTECQSFMNEDDGTTDSIFTLKRRNPFILSSQQ